MSWKGAYAFIDAWKLSGFAEGSAWHLLGWMIRNTDDGTMTITRSQERLAEELIVCARQVRTAITFWERAGVLQVVSHGGGTGRKAAKYRIRLDNLQVFSLGLTRRKARKLKNRKSTVEVQEFHLGKTDPSLRNSNSSTEAAGTVEVPRVPQCENALPSSTVEAPLWKSNAPTVEVQSTYCGSPGVPGIQRFRDSEKKDMAPAQSQTAARRRAGPATPSGQPAHREPLSDAELDRKRQAAGELVKRENERLARLAEAEGAK